MRLAAPSGEPHGSAQQSILLNIEQDPFLVLGPPPRAVSGKNRHRRPWLSRSGLRPDFNLSWQSTVETYSGIDIATPLRAVGKP
jgi:hypothetical protein